LSFASFSNSFSNSFPLVVALVAAALDKDKDNLGTRVCPPLFVPPAPAVDGLLPPREDVDFLAPSDVVLECALVPAPAVEGLVPVDARPFAAVEFKDKGVEVPLECKPPEREKDFVSLAENDFERVFCVWVFAFAFALELELSMAAAVTVDVIVLCTICGRG